MWQWKIPADTESIWGLYIFLLSKDLVLVKSMAEARVKFKSPKQHSTIYIKRFTLLFLQSLLHTFQDFSTSKAVSNSTGDSSNCI